MAFPWQTVEPDMLQQLMGKILQGCSAAALAAPSSTGEGTLVLLFLISHWAFFFFSFQTSLKSELFHLFIS